MKEFCEGGSVKDFMQDQNRCLTEDEISYVCYCVVCALYNLKQYDPYYQLSVAKPTNFLITSNGHVKLSKFLYNSPCWL
jgi:serine/threonine protein kinase